MAFTLSAPLEILSALISWSKGTDSSLELSFPESRIRSFLEAQVAILRSWYRDSLFHLRDSPVLPQLKLIHANIVNAKKLMVSDDRRVEDRIFFEKRLPWEQMHRLLCLNHKILDWVWLHTYFNLLDAMNVLIASWAFHWVCKIKTAFRSRLDLDALSLIH